VFATPLALVLLLQTHDSTYDSPSTRALVELARAQQHADDRHLDAYDATVRQRLSIGLTNGVLAHDRTLYSQQTAARIRWRRDVGAVVDVTGD
ncbi:hypothetical protein RSW15_24045, partial [Escherichia coli]|uniref:hypothetical protein n=1 Tax=Escherichia coli TaxID=562 RepID=UPI0028DDB043